jgi:diacylglycerol kinase (ATP)
MTVSEASVLGARRILAVFNPAAGGERRARFERVVAAARAHGCAITVKETTAPGHAEAIAREVSSAQFDVIAAAGGDGTVNEVVNGLTDKGIALGIIPLGTANVLADEIGLGLGAGVEKVARALAFGPIRDMRVGRVNGRRFIMMAGVGFDADVVAHISLPLKKRLGPLAYVWQGIKQTRTYPFDSYDVTIDGVAYSAVWVVVCNGRRYGGPFIAAPDATLSDDRFYILLMNGRGWRSVLRYGVSLALGKIASWSDVRLVPGRDVSIAGAGQPVQADGDIVAKLPLRITVDPVPVPLIYPG